MAAEGMAMTNARTRCLGVPQSQIVAMYRAVASAALIMPSRNMHQQRIAIIIAYQRQHHGVNNHRRNSGGKAYLA